jgi:TolB-like protein/DNA-binding winged helix-turn-helix (wHTH) protein/Flp pilus assembly protein TadD
LSAASFQFDSFELDVKRYELRRNGRNLRLEKIPMELLITLVSREGELVSREEIIEKLWGQDVFVDTEHGINTAVRKIRQVLGDDSENPRFVQTVVGKGYRFIFPIVSSSSPEPVAAVSTTQHAAVPVQPEASALKLPTVRELRRVAGARWLLAIAAIFLLAALVGGNVAGIRDRLLGRTPAIHTHSLAVLPLENLSHDPAEEYFADGMTDELITDLAQIAGLRVISRTSVMRFKGARKSLPEIARQLNVDNIVEGTVERSGGHIRVRAQLIRAADDRHLWAESFEREPQDVLALQTEVASAIARQVQVKLLPGRSGGSRLIKPAAYEAYLKGRYSWNRRNEAGLQEGIQYFQQAIALDPAYAEAYSGLADSYTTLGYFSYLAPKEAFPQARAAALKALELDTALAEAHASLGYVKLYFEWDWPGAEAEFKQAIALNPNYATAHEWYSIYLTAMDRPQEAAVEIGRAHDLDPLSLTISTDMGFDFYYKRKYDEAIQQFQKTLQMNPKFPLAHLWLGRAYQQKGMYEDAIAEYEKADDALPGWIVTLAGIGNVYGVSGKKKEAREMLERLEKLSQRKYVTPYGVALVYVGLGDKDQALIWLAKAVEDRAHWLVWMRLDPRWDPIRGDPRFKEITRRVGFAS